MSDKYDNLTHSLRSSASPGGKRDFWDLQYRSKWKGISSPSKPRFKSYAHEPKDTLQALLGKKINFPMGDSMSLSIGRFNQKLPVDIIQSGDYFQDYNIESPEEGGGFKYKDNPMYGIKVRKRF